MKTVDDARARVAELLAKKALARASFASLGAPGLFDVDHVASATFTPAKRYASVRNIPGGGTTLVLPVAGPALGITYEFANEDGSAAGGFALTVDAGTWFIRGSHTFVSTTPYVWGRLSFDAVNGVWCLQQGA